MPGLWVCPFNNDNRTGTRISWWWWMWCGEGKKQKGGWLGVFTNLDHGLIDFLFGPVFYAPSVLPLFHTIPVSPPGLMRCLGCFFCLLGLAFASPGLGFSFVAKMGCIDWNSFPCLRFLVPSSGALLCRLGLREICYHITADYVYCWGVCRTGFSKLLLAWQFCHAEAY